MGKPVAGSAKTDQSTCISGIRYEKALFGEMMTKCKAAAGCSILFFSTKYAG
jgi:hypothetical protein